MTLEVYNARPKHHSQTMAKHALTTPLLTSTIVSWCESLNASWSERDRAIDIIAASEGSMLSSYLSVHPPANTPRP